MHAASKPSIARSAVRAAMLILLVLVAGGCRRFATVTGKVRYGDRAVTYGSVILLSADGTACAGVIEADGSYTINDVSPGSVRIVVISRDPSKGRVTARARKTTEAAAWFPLPAKYEKAETSGLGATIPAGSFAHDILLPEE
jgi:hypothetical protein